MKTRKLLSVLLCVVLLVAYYLLGTDYLKQRQEREVLASQITEAAQMLAQVPAPPADLEERLAATQASLEGVRNSFPEELNSTRVINTILKLADEVGVKAIPLITQPWAIESVNDYDYSVFRLNVAVTGTYTQLGSFLSQLENGELQTLTVESLRVIRLTESSGVESIPRDNIQVNASLDIAVHSQSPTIDQ